MQTNILQKYRIIEDVLAKAFDHFNKTFANGEMNPPIIVIASDPSESKLGHFHRNSWVEVKRTEGEEDVKVEWHEIKINAGWLHKRGIDVLETLLHEMAHQWNEMKGIKDVAGVRHNVKFKEAAEMFGLIVEKQGHRGLAHTELGDKAKEAIKELNIDLEMFNIGFAANKMKKPSKYIALQIDKTDHNYEMIDALTANYGSKKEMIEYALTRLYNDEVNPLLKENLSD